MAVLTPGIAKATARPAATIPMRSRTSVGTGLRRTKRKGDGGGPAGRGTRLSETTYHIGKVTAHRTAINTSDRNLEF